MFLRLYLYRLKNIFFTKEITFWTLLFPIILGTFFYLGFGGLMNGKEVELSPIPVAVVTENDNETFLEVLKTLEQDSEQHLLTTTYTDADHAIQLLKEKDITGIIYIADTPHLTIAENGLNETILQSFITQYIMQADVIETIASTHPEKLPAAIEKLSSDSTYNREVSLVNAAYDPYIQYFYALIAMTCLFGTAAGVHCVMSMQADQSALGMRREIAPVHKMTVILSDFFGTFTLQFASILLLFFYLIVILGIDFGERTPLIILTGLVGTVIGIAAGLFIGAVIKGSDGVKVAVAMVFTMLNSFLSGLMVNNIKDLIEHYCPIINRLNPAALITDCLYALNMYESYDRFIKDISIMAIMAAVLCFGSYLLLRRTKYASL